MVDIIERVLERGYPDIARPDSSVELRNKFRAYWARGEQLWDVDMNNNYKFMNWWLAPTVDFRRLPFPPWPRRILPYSMVVLDGEWKDCIAFVTSSEVEYMRPFKGAMLYVKADRMFVGYDGTGWKPIAENPFYWRPSIEVAFFASEPKPLQQIAAYTVQESFTIFKDGRGCRARSINPKIMLDIYKNDGFIGKVGANASATASVFQFTRDETFVPGDVLSLKSPEKLLGTRNVSVSFLGKLHV